MTFGNLIEATFLGLVEGITEFLPVSSTGHLLLTEHFLGFAPAGKTFAVLIQLGAILSVIVVYWARFWNVAIRLPTEPSARRFVIGLILGFLPAAVIGVLAHDFIKKVLFESPATICIALILGGIVLMVIDRLKLEVRQSDAMTLSPRTCFLIGCYQTVAMIPGVSRSGATIVGAMLLGVEKRAAAEFSFFLAVPTMAGAFVYDLYKNWRLLAADDSLLIFVGFVAAFCAALLVGRTMVDFIGRHGFAPFAYYRIGLGAVGLAALWLVG